MLTGRQVRQSVRGFSTAKAIKVIVNEQIEPVSELPSDISHVLNAIVMKCLEKDKNRRFQSARELHTQLKRLKKKLNILYGPSDLAGFMKRHFRDNSNTDSDRTIREHSHSK